MKILVLMPLDQQHVDAAAGIYNNLPKEVQEITFPMPMFMEYAVISGVSKNWTYAFFDTIVSANNICKSATKQDNLIVIGNVAKEHEFDVVFNFQEIDETLPYQDLFAEKLLEVVESEPTLTKVIKNLHKGPESVFSLQNCKATAEFLTKYLDTDPKIDELRASYQGKLNLDVK